MPGFESLEYQVLWVDFSDEFWEIMIPFHRNQEKHHDPPVVGSKDSAHPIAWHCGSRPVTPHRRALPGRANAVACRRHRRPGAARRLLRPQGARVSDRCARQCTAADAQHRQRSRADRRRRNRAGARRGRRRELRHGGHRDAVRLQNAPARGRYGQLQRMAADQWRRGGPAVQYARHARPDRGPAQAAVSPHRLALGERRLRAELIQRHPFVRELRWRHSRRSLSQRPRRTFRASERRGLGQLAARSSG